MTEAEDTARALRGEAKRLLAETGICESLAGRFGGCTIVGSFALDLMSWRDLDIYVPVERSEIDRFVAMLPPLHAAFAAAGWTIVRATFNDEWAKPRGDYGSGYYWGLRARATEAPVWKLDLWGWVPADHDRKLAEFDALKQALGRADRSRLLALKHEALRHPGFRDSLTSHDIYRFVLAGAGTTFAELLDFCAARRAS